MNSAYNDYNEKQKQMLYNDLENVYKNCLETCKTILKSNTKSHESNFILFKYVHLESFFKLLLQHHQYRKFSKINIVYPSSNMLKGHDYEAVWIDDESLNIVADFAAIYIMLKDNRNVAVKEILFTLPVWAVFLKKIIHLCRGIKITHVHF